MIIPSKLLKRKTTSTRSIFQQLSSEEISQPNLSGKWRRINIKTSSGANKITGTTTHRTKNATLVSKLPSTLRLWSKREPIRLRKKLRRQRVTCYKVMSLWRKAAPAKPNKASSRVWEKLRDAEAPSLSISRMFSLIVLISSSSSSYSLNHRTIGSRSSRYSHRHPTCFHHQKSKVCSSVFLQGWTKACRCPS